MGTINRYRMKSIAIFIFIAMLFSCQNRINKVRQMNATELIPKIEELDMNLVYTDSGKVAAKLRSPRMLDFTDQKFPYREFPDGVHVTFYDKKDRKKNTAESDYAIQFEGSQLIDMRGHVKIVTSDSTILEARQLYWDQDQEWLFTDMSYTIKMNNGTTNKGQGF